MPEQILEQFGFSKSEGDFFPRPSYAPLQEVHLQVIGLENGFRKTWTSPEQHAQSSQQLGEGKRLDQIVVGAGIQADHAILDCITGRQDQDGQFLSRLSKISQNLETLFTGQEQIQNDAVERATECQ